MENEIITPEQAKENGFILSREQALEATDWSKATLARKMKEMTEGKHFVTVKGKTKPTPVFHTAILQMAGIESGEAVEPQTMMRVENKNVSRLSQDNLKKISSDTFPEQFTNALILPHKIYVTLDEAKQLTGFPKSALHKYSEIKHGRRVIKKSKLEKI